MNKIAAAIVRACCFTHKFGNLFYLLLATFIFNFATEMVANIDLLAQADDADLLGFSESYISFLIFAHGRIMVLYFFAGIVINKILDGVARIGFSLEQEPVPFVLFSVIRRADVVDFGSVFFGTIFIGVILLILVPFFIPFAFLAGMAGSIMVLPLMMLSFLKFKSRRAMFQPRKWQIILRRIRLRRYCVCTFFSAFLLVALLRADIAIFTRLIDEPLTLHWYTPATAAQAWTSLPLYFYHFSFNFICLWMVAFNCFLVAFVAPRRHFRKMSHADRHRIDVSLVENGILTKPRVAAEPPPDLSLLDEAVTEAMTPAQQQAFARVLARADELIAQGKADRARVLLRPYTGERHHPLVWFPAYQRLYALQDETILPRLIATAASGHQSSFDLIRPELERINPATLPADLIYPLAQRAARQQHYPVVLTLTRGFAQHHPDHPQLINNYLLAARALAKTGHAERAQQLLTQMLSRFAHHEKAAQIRATLNLLQQQR